MSEGWLRRVLRALLSKWSGAPLRLRILALVLPLTAGSVILTGVISYTIEVRQLTRNEEYLIENATTQMVSTVNEKFSAIFLQLVNLSNSAPVERLIANDYGARAPQEKYNDIIDVSNRMNTISETYSAMVDSVYFCNNAGTDINVFNNGVARSIGVDLGAMLRRYGGRDASSFWLNEHPDTVFATVPRRNVVTTFTVFGSAHSASSGLLLINLSGGYFSGALSNYEISQNGYLMMLGSGGAMYSEKVPKRYALTAAETANLSKKLRTSGKCSVLSAAQERLDLIYRPIAINGWLIVSVVPRSDVIAGAEKMKYYIALLMLAMLLVTSILGTVLAKTISTPIVFLSKQVKRFHAGELNISFGIRQNNEIGVLAKGLANLVSTVDRLISQVRKEQEMKTKLELLALQSQIKPHFLYNTLGSIRHLIDMGRQTEASGMCTALTKFYMLMIGKGGDIVTVREEIEHLEYYLTIQKMRYPNLDYSIDVDEDIRQVPVPRLTLQPLVENSVYHGIKNKAEGGMVLVTGKHEDGKIVLSVYDDGAGMSPRRLELLKEAVHGNKIEENPETFGMKNVNQRLRLFYKDRYALQIDSVEGVFTQVRLVIAPERNEGDRDENV